jgi:flavin-dependent dehydrogenase
LASVVGARHTGIWIEWGGPRRFEAFGRDASGPWSGFQVWRADFDRLLLTRARETGVAVRQPCAVTRVRMHDRAPHNVVTDVGPVATRMVIDATGTTRFLARALGVVCPARSLRLIARYGYTLGACPLRDEAPALVGDASGWTWTAMVRLRTYQWTRVSFTDRTANDWVPEELRDLPSLGRARGADVTWRLATQVAGAGWFMVGDAAATLDPTSSRGVLKAIMSGMMAAHLVAAVLNHKAPADEAASAYHDWLSGWFATDAAHLSRFYRDLGVAAFV